MTIAGLMLVKNEDWILGFSARVALQWVDHLVMLLHDCSDGSEDIARQLAKEFPSRVWIFSSYDKGWPEMVHRQAALELALSDDGPRATHIALIDADEVITANLVGFDIDDTIAGTPTVREMFRATPPETILQVPYFYLRGPAGLFHTNGVWKPRVTSLGFRYRPGLHWAGDRFHHREPMGPAMSPHLPLRNWTQGGVLHYWAADERRHKAKHALYKITERLRWPHKAWADIERYYGYATRSLPGEPWTFAKLPDNLVAPYYHLIREHVHYDREPWQEAEARRLVSLHGREPFEGMDLLGVV